MLFLWILDKKKNYCCRYFSSPTSGKKSLKPRAVSQHGLSVASRQLAQYCETGGAVDSMLEGFFFIIIIVNCLFLYRSKVRVKRINTSYTSMSCTFHCQLRLEVLLAIELWEILTRRGLDCVQSSKTKNVTSELKSLFIFQCFKKKIFRPNIKIVGCHFKTLALSKKKNIQNTIMDNCNLKYL